MTSSVSSDTYFSSVDGGGEEGEEIPDCSLEGGDVRWWQLSRELRSTYSRVTLPGVGIFSQIYL